MYEKDEAVWYLDRHGTWLEGRITHVDRSLVPPAYQVQTEPDSTTRDTESPRLLPRCPGAPHPGDCPPSAVSPRARTYSQRSSPGEEV